MAWAKWVKIFGLGCSYSKILGPSKTGPPGPISSSDESGVSTTELQPGRGLLFRWFCFFGKFGLKTVKLLCLCSKCETIFWYSLYDRMHGYGNKYDIVT